MRRWRRCCVCWRRCGEGRLVGNLKMQIGDELGLVRDLWIDWRDPTPARFSIRRYKELAFDEVYRQDRFGE